MSTWAPSPRYSVVVASDGTGDYSTIQSAITALSTGGKILVKKGTYNITSGLTISTSNLVIEGEGPSSVITFNGASVTPAIANSDTAQRTNIVIKDIKIDNTGSAGNGVGIDATYFARSRFENIFIEDTNGGILLNSANALYNLIENCTISVSGTNSYGVKLDTNANENTLKRLRIITTSASTGVIVNAHGSSLYDIDVETGAAIGIDIQSSGHDTTIYSPYLEGNVINLKVAANVESTTIIGGIVVDGSTYNIQNLGAKGLNIYNTRVQYEQFTYSESLNSFPGVRWLIPYHTGIAATDQLATAGRVLLQLFETQQSVFADGVTIVNGTVAAGNVTVGIYGPITTEETCNGAPLLIESSSTATSGTSTAQTISLTKTLLKPGRYYVAVEYSNAAHTYFRNTNATQIIGWAQYYDRGGGYGALTDPCPTITETGSAIPGVRIKCASLTTV